MVLSWNCFLSFKIRVSVSFLPQVRGGIHSPALFARCTPSWISWWYTKMRDLWVRLLEIVQVNWKLRSHDGTGEMVQWVRASDPVSDDLSSTPRIQTVREKNRLLPVVLCDVWVHMHACAWNKKRKPPNRKPNNNKSHRYSENAAS